jgi:hypothetical protein
LLNAIADLERRIDADTKELNRYKAALSAIDGDIQRTARPRLDGLRIADATRKYVKWALDSGEQVTMADIDKELARHEVYASGKRLLKDTQIPFKTICTALGNPANADIKIHRNRVRGIERGDLVTLS